MSRAARCLYKTQRRARRKASSYVRDGTTRQSAAFDVADLRLQLGENSRRSQLGAVPLFNTKLAPGDPDSIINVNYVQFNKKRPPVMKNEMVKVKRNLFGEKLTSNSLLRSLKQSLKLKKSELDKTLEVGKSSAIPVTTPSISGNESIESIDKVSRSNWISSQTFTDHSSKRIHSKLVRDSTKFQLSISEPEPMESDSDVSVFSILASPNFKSDLLTEPAIEDPVDWWNQDKGMTRDWIHNEPFLPDHSREEMFVPERKWMADSVVDCWDWGSK